MYEILRYQDEKGRVPFGDWLVGLRDKTAAARIRVRLRQVSGGNLGDTKPVGEGVNELRIHVGAGYRVYFGQYGKDLIILLYGGDKATQPADIERAKRFWKDWKERQE